MNPEIRKYLSAIGRRGGSATSEKKASAVRRNGSLGGRPRKDGRLPGSKSLDDVIRAIESSGLPKPAKLDLMIWARAKATFFHERTAFLRRDDAVRVKEMLATKARVAKKSTR